MLSWRKVGLWPFRPLCSVRRTTQPVAWPSSGLPASESNQRTPLSTQSSEANTLTYGNCFANEEEIETLAVLAEDMNDQNVLLDYQEGASLGKHDRSPQTHL